MFKKMGTETKVGLFAIACIVIIVFATIKVGDRSVVAGGGYEMMITMESAIGIKPKTPVEIAGIQVGVVKKIRLDKMSRARVVLSISKSVKLPEGTTAYVRSKGFLGETFVEIRPGSMENQALARKTEIPYGGVTGDVNVLLTQFNEIASDIKAVTGTVRDLVGTDESSPVYRSVMNIDKFAEVMKDITMRNEANMNKIISNLAVLTGELRGVVERRREDLEMTLVHLNSITRKVDEGHGTVGRLINDDETVNKVNTALDGLNDTLGGLRRLETEIGYHAEYLGNSHDFKHYVHLNLMPSPDEAFMLAIVSDPAPPPSRSTRTTDITAGGATSTITTNTETIEYDKLRVSAQIAKKFYDFTFRGGLIESTGGVGLDYNKGPVGVSFSAFDFGTRFGDRPHLKAWGNLNVSDSFYLMGGADDFINPRQPADWFVGAGIRFTDENIKSLLGMGAAKAIR
jgi:phospholipid/cholesterol/gamma-HCH transport system substrate-binding protein